MKVVRQKRQLGTLDGTPDKRMYWSIISDYDLKSSICELIDNAIDLWTERKSAKDLEIILALDIDRQLIQIVDTAGGVREEDLRLLVAPGASSNSPDAETIGIFGVGSKRAVVALAETVAIRTRYAKSMSFQIDISKDWLESEDWEIPHFEIPEIDEGSTKIDLSALRKSLVIEDVEELSQHLEVTYAKFLRSGVNISLNGVEAKAQSFENWAFPKGFEPRKASFSPKMLEYKDVRIEIFAGLILDRDAVGENYGVYFYCNDRLIVKELKVRDVGYFISSEAGVPHPDASLCRAIVKIRGPAKLMPWNSSKSAINFGHPIFQLLRPTLIQLVTHFSSLSRRLKNDWDKEVFAHKRGEIQSIEPIDSIGVKKLVLPTLPRVNRTHVEVLKADNKKNIHDQPWTLGLIEAISAVDVISRQKLETKNRIALILLDSNFEIALKEFIVHRTDLFPFKTTRIDELFANRNNVIDAVASQVTISKILINKTKHYYGLRNKLIHERATVDIANADVENYRESIEDILHILFGLNF